MLRIVLALFSIVVSHVTSSPVFQSTHGPIEGKTISLVTGKTVDTFLGIPFAAPPIGQNRFAPPQPLERWNQTRKAQSLPVSCIQGVPDVMKKTVWYVADLTENEDCLYLNIWVPNKRTEKRMAVMIWIHGGGFDSGSSAMPLYDGGILASENNVVVASMNYRLSIFGFLFTNSTQVPGNAGLQDQIQAINWIRNNVEAIGGDPSKITLFGESAGGISTSIHLTNMKLNDVFQYAVLESGTMLTPQGTVDTTFALSTSMAFANNVGCSSDDMQQMLNCLRGKKAEDLSLKKDILEKTTLTACPVRNGIEVPINIFTAVQEIPANKRKNIMSGSILSEAGLGIPEFLPGKIMSDNLTVTENEENSFIEMFFRLSDSRLQSMVKHEYRHFEESYNMSEKREEVSDIGTDAFLLCPQIGFTKSWVTNTNQVYYYYWKYRPSKSTKVPLPKWLGPTHGDELPFVFGLPLDHKNGYNDAEVIFSRKIMSIWTNFAKTGNPNGVSQTPWPYLKPNEVLENLDIDMNADNQVILTAEKGLKERECSFWNEEYPFLFSIQQQLDQCKTARP